MNRRLFIGASLSLCAGALMLPAALKGLMDQEGDLLEMELKGEPSPSVYFPI